MYRCRLCKSVSPAGMPRLVHRVFKPGTQETQCEVEVCLPCKAKLRDGDPAVLDTLRALYPPAPLQQQPKRLGTPVPRKEAERG